MLKTWQFSQKTISKNILNLQKKKKFPKEKRKKSPKILSIYLLIKRQNLSRKKITCSVPNQHVGVGTLAKVLLTPIFYIMPSHCFDMYY
jgi:hypothetical protein